MQIRCIKWNVEYLLKLLLNKLIFIFQKDGLWLYTSTSCFWPSSPTWSIINMAPNIRWTWRCSTKSKFILYDYYYHKLPCKIFIKMPRSERNLKTFLIKFSYWTEICIPSKNKQNLLHLMLCSCMYQKMNLFPFFFGNFFLGPSTINVDEFLSFYWTFSSLFPQELVPLFWWIYKLNDLSNLNYFF